MQSQPDIPETVGRFRVVRRLGEGGFAEVFLGQDPDTLGLVALKVLRAGIEASLAEQVRARFLAEERISKAIDHDAVVRIREASAAGADPCFLAMEFVEGVPFCEYFRAWREERARPRAAFLAEVARLGRVVAEAMALAHAGGIVHRDLKPDNVLVCPLPGARRAGDPPPSAGDGAPVRVKILDFGIAKAPIRLFARDGATTFSRYWTGLGTVMGSPPFMAPEQNGAAHAVTGKADVFALGMMLLVTLLKLDPDALELEPASLALAGDWAELCRREDLPEAWQGLVLSMTAEEPAERPEMGDVALRLQRLSRGDGEFGAAVESWVREGRLPSPGAVERLVSEAEGLRDWTADERAFVQRAPLLVLTRVRRRVGLAVTLALLTACTALGGAAWLTRPGPPPAPAEESRATLPAPQPPAADRSEEVLAARAELERAAKAGEARLSTIRALNGELAERRLDRAAAERRARDNAERLAAAEAALASCRDDAARVEQSLNACRHDLALSADQLSESAERLGLCSRSLREKLSTEPSAPEPDSLTN